jgi:hypothetical protein
MSKGSTDKQKRESKWRLTLAMSAPDIGFHVLQLYHGYEQVRDMLGYTDIFR